MTTSRRISPHSPRSLAASASARSIDVRIDPLRKLRHQGRVARRRHPHEIRGERCSPPAAARLEGRQQLAVDVVEAAVRHDHDEIAVPALARDGLDDVVDLRDVAGVDAGCLRDRRSAAPPTAADLPAASNGTRQAGPRCRPSPGRGRSRTERCGGRRSPNAARRSPRSADPGNAGADARQCLCDRGRMMREVVVDRYARRRAAQLHPAADALEPAQPVRQRVGVAVRPPRRRRSRRARCARCRRRAAAARTADRLAVAPHAEGRRRARRRADRAPASRRRRSGRTSRPGTARARASASASALSAPRSSRPRRGIRLTNR